MMRQRTPARTTKTIGVENIRSRRSVLAAALALPVAGALAMAAFRRANAVEQVSKEEANYRDQPKGEQMCAGCGHYRAPDACERVEGEISPNGWCKYWKQR